MAEAENNTNRHFAGLLLDAGLAGGFARWLVPRTPDRSRKYEQDSELPPETSPCLFPRGISWERKSAVPTFPQCGFGIKRWLIPLTMRGEMVEGRGPANRGYWRGWRTREGIAHPYALLPTFDQNVFQRRERFQKFRGHESAAPRAVKLFPTLSLRFPQGWWAPFIFLCLLSFPGPNHLWVARLVHGDLP